MTLILTVGDWSDRSEYIAHLTRAGYLVGWADPSADPSHQSPGFHPAGLVALLESRSDIAAAAGLARRFGTPWVAWDSGSDTSADAYLDGARAVLRSEISPEGMAQVVAELMDDDEAPARQIGDGEVLCCRRSETIDVDAESAVVVLSGEVAIRAVDPSGSQCLKGIFGAGDVLLAHPPGHGCVDLVAHSDARISVHQWRDVALTWDIADRMWRSQTYLTAWSAMQSRVRIDHRLLGVLTLLAERFGRSGQGGWVVIDVRLTYEQLAEIVGASRTAVSSATGELLAAGAVRIKGGAKHRRIQLHTKQARALIPA